MSIVPTKVVVVIVSKSVVMTTMETLCRVHACLSPRCTSTSTLGVSLEVVELEVVSCVMEKLVNRIAEGGWEFIPSPTVDTLYFRRQKVW